MTNQIITHRNRFLAALIGPVGIAVGGLLIFAIPYLWVYGDARELSGSDIAALIIGIFSLAHGIVFSISAFTGHDPRTLYSQTTSDQKI